MAPGDHASQAARPLASGATARGDDGVARRPGKGEATDTGRGLASGAPGSACGPASRAALRSRSYLQAWHDVRGGGSRPGRAARDREIPRARGSSDFAEPVPAIEPVMMHPPADRLRSYAQGIADVTARVLVEAHLSLCQTCSAAIPQAQQGAKSLPAATLHDELDLPPFDCVWKSVEQATRTRRFPEADVLPPTLLSALSHPCVWPWIVLTWPAKVRVALLIRDTETGSELYLCHLAPRSTFPHHRHVGLEENVVLAGGYQNADVCVDTGDWIIGAPGTEERSKTEDGSCWCLSRIEPPGVRFSGWRGWASPFFSS